MRSVRNLNAMRILIVCWAAAMILYGQKEYIEANYTKYEFRIPMRDGKRLFTSVYVPKKQDQKYPILMSRTPYSVAPYGEDQYPETFRKSEKFVKEGYIFVFQDVRG